MKNAGQRLNNMPSLSFLVSILESNRQHLELYFLTAAVLNFMATFLALAVCAALKLNPWWAGAVFAVTNPLWAHAALWVWRWRYGKKMAKAARSGA